MPNSREIILIVSAYGLGKTFGFNNHGIAEITCRTRYFDDALRLVWKGHSNAIYGHQKTFPCSEPNGIF